MIRIEDYILTKNVLNLIKKDSDFKGRFYKEWLYKDTIMFEFVIHADGKRWDYQVLDDCNNSIYCSYYNRRYGVNELVDKLDDAIIRVLNNLIDRGILERRGNGNGYDE